MSNEFTRKYKVGDKIRVIEEITSKDLFGDDPRISDECKKYFIPKWAKGVVETVGEDFIEVSFGGSPAWMLIKSNDHQIQKDVVKDTPEVKYETRLIIQWAENVEGIQEFCQQAAEESPNLYRTEKTIREYFEESNPLADEANIYADLLSAGLREVQWDIVAQYFWDNRDK